MRTFFVLIFLALCTSLRAQIFLVDTNSVHSEDFNSLDSSGTGSTRLPAGWSFREWGSAANVSYRAGTGSVNASDTYSFGTARSRDRALGSLASGTLTKISYGLMFINQSGSDINAVSITYKGEQWRRGGSGSPDSLRCFLTTVRGSTLDDSSLAKWTEPPSLLFRSVSVATGSAAVNGNDSSRVLHADLPLMLHPGDTLWLRWIDLNAAGSDDGLAVDSLTVAFRNGPVTQSNHPRLLRFSPDSNASGLAPGLRLSLMFDRSVTPGGGYISVWNLFSNNIDRIPAIDGQAVSGGREYVFTGLDFQPGYRYLIRFDSSAFDSAGYSCTGLYSTDWIFMLAPLSTGEVSSNPPLTLQATQDGKLLVVTSATSPRQYELFTHAADGRLLRRQMVAVNAGMQLLDPGLPPGSTYLVTLRTEGTYLRTRLCVP